MDFYKIGVVIEFSVIHLILKLVNGLKNHIEKVLKITRLLCY
nr:MAG TPA: hypothetical protein [Caudoviricetes sp.]